ncbi:hypothetical protein LWI29_011521 [Acer saccharum]|uniref:Protein kinase domain-containing protein n=1 Tax=Acer saccharum TaxID=4024 RepID=A0AA39RRG2_ACESA|nr:hypothetical protein LWI29_011521 [Acer saccharum]
MAAAVVLSSASTTIHWFLLFSYFLSLFMSQSCLADDQYFKLHRGRLVSRKLCPSCKLYPFFRDSPIVAARESVAWIPVLASVSAAAVMVLLCSFLWHTSRRNHLYEEELQENGQNQTGILGSRESTTGNDNTDDTLEEGNQQVECPDLSLFPLNLIRKVTKYFSIEKKIGNQVVVESTQDLPLFPLDVIYEATQNFSVENKIGQGGFGTVYKGILGDGKEIAVKRLSKTSRQGIKEFEKEIWELWCEGQSLDELMDPAVVQSCDHIELMRCIHIGLLCVQRDPIDRPTMSSIVVMLTSDEINLPQPNSPAFDPRSPVRSTDTWGISISINELTLSIEFPR